MFTFNLIPKIVALLIATIVSLIYFFLLKIGFFKFKRLPKIRRIPDHRLFIKLKEEDFGPSVRLADKFEKADETIRWLVKLEKIDNLVLFTRIRWVIYIVFTLIGIYFLDFEVYVQNIDYLWSIWRNFRESHWQFFYYRWDPLYQTHRHFIFTSPFWVWFIIKVWQYFNAYVDIDDGTIDWDFTPRKKGPPTDQWGREVPYETLSKIEQEDYDAPSFNLKELHYLIRLVIKLVFTSFFCLVSMFVFHYCTFFTAFVWNEIFFNSLLGPIYDWFFDNYYNIWTREARYRIFLREDAIRKEKAIFREKIELEIRAKIAQEEKLKAKIAAEAKEKEEANKRNKRWWF